MKIRPLPDGRNVTAGEVKALQKMYAAERAALAGMRALADFDVLCRLSEELCATDREYRRAQRQATREYKRRHQR